MAQKPASQGDLAKVLQNIITASDNASKIVDENGEPRVVYHQTNAEAYVNVETGQEWDDLSWQEKMEWDNRIAMAKNEL